MSKTTSNQALVTVKVSRKFKATPERVFDAWLDPQKARQFLFADDPDSIIKADIDAKIGGSFLFIVRKDGKDWDHIGEFVEIDRPRRLVFDFVVPSAWPEKSRIAISITLLESGCELTLVHEGLDPDLEKSVFMGWTSSLDNLEKYCASSDDEHFARRVSCERRKR